MEAGNDLSIGGWSVNDWMRREKGEDKDAGRACSPFSGAIGCHVVRISAVFTQ